MANLITGDDDLFNAYISGSERVENRNFLARQWEKVSSVVSERGKQFMQRTRDVFDSYDTDKVGRGLRAIKRRLSNRWGHNEIVSLGTIGELQNANVKMVRWLAANPRVRKEAHRGRCNGWSDSYVDLEPGLWGEQHTDYKRVMNGMAQTDEEGNTFFVTYFDAIEDGNEELIFDEQCDIIRGWDLTNDCLDAHLDDPTDVNNGAL
jgi:hypothetical protein